MLKLCLIFTLAFCKEDIIDIGPELIIKEGNTLTLDTLNTELSQIKILNAKNLKTPNFRAKSVEIEELQTSLFKGDFRLNGKLDF